MHLSKVAYMQNSPTPLPRTYHATCLIRNFMVVIGGEAQSDLKDFWALDLENYEWKQPEVLWNDQYTPKRFHSATPV